MQILAVGVATIDVLLRVSVYPVEDEKIRALTANTSRGGNATNTLVVLSQLGHVCSWAGALAADVNSDLILKDLMRYRIDYSACRRYDTGQTPVSYVLLSEKTNSRTIIHHRDLPEFSALDFRSIELSDFEWVHFEGRNVPETLEMLQHLKKHYPNLPLSLEVEKPREQIEKLFPHADLILLSRDYALSQGCEEPAELFNKVRKLNGRATLSCTWGDRGAWLMNSAGQIHFAAPWMPPKVIDTLGAGDVFNAGIIHGMIQQKSPDRVLADAVGLAGKKCGQSGFARLVEPHGR